MAFDERADDEGADVRGRLWMEGTQRRKFSMQLTRWQNTDAWAEYCYVGRVLLQGDNTDT